jgi:tRNA threonylcarbamoyladenosine biosynthesis protein TsaB
VRLLAVDTAGPVIGVSARSGAGSAHRVERIARGAESRLVPWALEVCAELGVELADLDAVAVAAGPGAFTGLRVGLATACGLAQAIDVPVWSGCSLRARAHHVLGVGRPVLALLDARKSRVYAALFASDGTVLRPPADVDPHVAVGWVTPDALATGEGAVVYGDLLRASGIAIIDEPTSPGAAALLDLAIVGLAAGEGTEPEQVRPVYLRAPDARPPSPAR